MTTPAQVRAMYDDLVSEHGDADSPFARLVAALLDVMEDIAVELVAVGSGREPSTLPDGWTDGLAVTPHEEPATCDPDRVRDAHREIVPGLWHGSRSAHLPPGLHAVVTCSREVLLQHPVPAPVLHHLFLFSPVLGWDGEVERHEIPPRRRVVEMADRIAGWLDQGERVLVRCNAGLHRSALLVVAVLVRRGWDVDAAISLVRDRWSDGDNRHDVFEKSRYERWLRKTFGATSRNERQSA